MKVVLGVLLIAAGIAFGVYVGVWLCLVGGIVQIVHALQATPIEALDLALGILRVLCTGAAGGLTAVVSVIPGMAMLATD